MDFNTEKFLGYPPASALCTRDNGGRLHRLRVGMQSQATSTASSGPLRISPHLLLATLVEAFSMLLSTQKVCGSARPYFVGIRMEPAISCTYMTHHLFLLHH
uniref:Uncharacterized protein n=1 Tax=Strongyloides venezuelensis TaxID=75913 RepID=A0A0K0G338_STRVS